MKFGDTPVAEAEGAVLAHGLHFAGGSLKKGRVLSAADVAQLRAAGIASVIAARAEPDDLGEDAAAARLAAALGSENLTATAAFTGRCNLYAGAHGVLAIDRDRLDRLNLVDEAVTVATLQPYDVVEPRQMVATIKIIPYAVRAATIAHCEALAREGGPLLRVAAFRPKSAALIQTRTEGTKQSVLDSTAEVTRTRLQSLGGTLAGETRCAHLVEPLVQDIAAAMDVRPDLLLISGASAITDRRDVIPAAIERAGGEVIHLGMPVDPGNLLLLGALDGIDVLGAPGCARSPRENGFDWVLSRLLADEKVGAADIAGLGVGGLLMEIVSRPQPREGKAAEGGGVAAVILAAGRSRRMGGRFKLTEEVGGKPLVAHAVDAAAGAGIGEIVVVTGNRADEVRAALGDRPVRFVHNEAYAEGLSTSLKAGIGALGGTCAGALVMLADMPGVDAALLTRLMNMFKTGEGTIVVPAHGGKRGNPVLWARRYFGELASLEGDTGARHLIGVHGEAVREVEAGSDAIFLDIDTPEALAAARGKPVSTP